MMGKILAVVLGFSAVLAGAALYYLQVYGFYDEVTPTPGQDVVLMPLDGSAPLAIAYDGFQAIDADSSPIRYRACFTTDQHPDVLAAQFSVTDMHDPRNAPGWFDCFDAPAIARDLATGSATAFIGVKNIHFGVDRIVAITQDGRGYAWHELNNCGHKAYDGTVVGEECPPRD